MIDTTNINMAGYVIIEALSTAVTTPDSSSEADNLFHIFTETDNSEGSSSLIFDTEYHPLKKLSDAQLKDLNDKVQNLCHAISAKFVPTPSILALR